MMVAQSKMLIEGFELADGTVLSRFATTAGYWPSLGPFS